MPTPARVLPRVRVVRAVCWRHERCGARVHADEDDLVVEPRLARRADRPGSPRADGSARRGAACGTSRASVSRQPHHLGHRAPPLLDRSGRPARGARHHRAGAAPRQPGPCRAVPPLHRRSPPRRDAGVGAAGAPGRAHAPLDRSRPEIRGLRVERLLHAPARLADRRRRRGDLRGKCARRALAARSSRSAPPPASNTAFS